MHVVRSNGEAQALDPFDLADALDLLDKKRSQDWTKDLSIEFGPPDEVIIKLVVGVATQIIPCDLEWALDQGSGLVIRAHARISGFLVATDLPVDDGHVMEKHSEDTTLMSSN